MIEADEESTSAAQDACRAASRPINMSSTSSGMVVSIVPYSWEPPVVVARATGGREANHNMPFSRARCAAAVRLSTSNLRMADRR